MFWVWGIIYRKSVHLPQQVLLLPSWQYGEQWLRFTGTLHEGTYNCTSCIIHTDCPCLPARWGI